MSRKKLSEKCGIVGIYHPSYSVASSTFFSLFSLQHRGQESAGIASSDEKNFFIYKNTGLINEVFDDEIIGDLRGNIAIGHTRYSTTGRNNLDNTQPFKASGQNGEIFLGHNGNIINSEDLMDLLSTWNISSFNTTSDSELLTLLYANAPGRSWSERSEFVMSKTKGAYSLVILTQNSLIAVRDPLGIRPLVLGKYREGYAIASETCALDHIGSSFIREIAPGETLEIKNNKLNSSNIRRKSDKVALCSFEHIYLSRPDSILDGKLTYSVRMKMGETLASEHPVEADLVIGIPDSAIASAVGYANKSKIPFVHGIVKNRYVGRTFISPDQKLRDLGVKIKFNTLNSIIKGKKVVVVDDSIVRGTTTPEVIRMIKDAGALEVHMRVASPPVISTCHFGVDTGSSYELIAANRRIFEIKRLIGADSLEYLSVNGLKEAIDYQENYCIGCFTKEYPIPVQMEMDKLKLESIQRRENV